MLRPQDRLTACEIEPNAHKQLVGALRRDTQARVVDLDGWTALPAFVPPNERRGLVLIDPSFEQKDEFERLADGFTEAFGKWPTGSYLLWYPVKSRRVTDNLARPCRRRGRNQQAGRKMPAAGIQRRAPGSRWAADLDGTADRQPAWTLAARAEDHLPELEKPLGQGGASRFRLETPKP